MNTDAEIINLLRAHSNKQRIREGSRPVRYAPTPTNARISSIVPLNPPVASSLPCRLRGLDVIDEFSCKTCGGKEQAVPVFACQKHGRCTVHKSFAGTMCCNLCDDRVIPDTPTHSIIPANPPSAGIVVGFFGLPALAKLQILTIRETCGAVPILLADDGSNRDREFLDLTKQFAGVEFWPTTDRAGHYAGDLSVFYKGLQWAATRNLTWLCKLSQRFLWTRPGWLSDAVSRLEKSRSATMMQTCLDNNTNLFVRSESMILDVRAWLPHYRELYSDQLVNPTELKIWHIIHSHFNESYCKWDALPVNRYQRAEGTIWHGSHNEAEFRNYARSKGVELDSEFHVNGAEKMPGWKRG